MVVLAAIAATGCVGVLEGEGEAGGTAAGSPTSSASEPGTGSSDGHASSDTEASSASSGSTMGPSTTDASDEFGDSGIPGCADAPESSPPIILDATHIRISTVPVICDEPVDGPYDCSYDQFDAILTVPDTYTPGMWTLPHPDVSLVVVHEWLGGYSPEQGCYCEPPSETTPFEIEVGTITLDVVTTLEGYPMGLMFEGFEYPLSGGTVVGTCG